MGLHHPRAYGYSYDPCANRPRRQRWQASLGRSDVPEPTVTHTALVSTDYEVDAGGVAWAFDIPEPTITHTAPAPPVVSASASAHTVERGNALLVHSLAWPPTRRAVRYPNAWTASPDVGTFADDDALATRLDSPLHSPVGPIHIQRQPAASLGYRRLCLFSLAVGLLPYTPVAIEVDWDKDGSFAHSASDVTGDLARRSLQGLRGRTLQSRRRAVSGRASFKLWNLNGKYDPLNSSSPIFEHDINGTPVRVRFSGVTVWGGVLDSVRNADSILCPLSSLLPLANSILTVAAACSVAAQQVRRRALLPAAWAKPPE